MKDTLVIFDVFPFLHIGEYVYKKYDNKVNGKMPCNGILYLLKRLSSELSYYKDVVLTFDSKSFRKDLDFNYKSNRRPNNTIASQAELLYELLPKAGIACYKKDRYEADDLIYNIVNANKDLYNHIYILGTDYDLTHNIIKPSIEFRSISSQVHSVTEQTFPYIMYDDMYLMYNTISAYKVFCGDNSDNVKKFKTSDGKYTGRDLYNLYVKALQKQQLSPDKTRSRSMLEYFINCTKQLYSVSDLAELKHRMDLVFPLADNSEDWTLTSSIRNYNKKTYLELLRIFEDQVSAKSLGTRVYTVNINPELLNIVSAMGDRLISGEFAADNSRSIRKNPINIDMKMCKEF